MLGRLVIYEDNDYDELLLSYSFFVNKNESSEINTIKVSYAIYSNKVWDHEGNFYDPQAMKDDTVVNGFTRIDKLCKALGALDRSGWDRSYQHIFHV